MKKRSKIIKKVEKVLKPSKKKFFLITLISVMFVVYLLFFYYRNIIFGPPVLFEEDDNIRIGLWPNGHQAAFVFTIDDINANTDISTISKIIDCLDKEDIKTTLFVIPNILGKKKITQNSSIAIYLKDLEKNGHEIAQHGLTHFSIRKSFITKNKFKELEGLPYSEQKRRILIGKNILEEAGFNVSGFRAPAFGITQDTFKILDDAGFNYDSDIRVSPWILMNNKIYADSLFYPFHIKGLNLIEIVANGDFFWVNSKLKENFYKILIRRFDIYYKKQGAFVLVNHIDHLEKEENFNFLKMFLDYQKDKNIWRTNMKNLADWWRIRENLYAESFIENKTIKIFLESSYENISGLTIYLKNPEVNYYEVYLNNILIKSGKASEKIII